MEPESWLPDFVVDAANAEPNVPFATDHDYFSALEAKWCATRTHSDVLWPAAICSSGGERPSRFQVSRPFRLRAAQEERFHACRAPQQV
jgi:hypothetical protein